MITWTNLGFLVLPIWLCPMMVVWGLTDRTLVWPTVAAQILSACILFPVGIKLNRPTIKHLFCGIRFEYWAFIFPAIVLFIYLGDKMLTGR